MATKDPAKRLATARRYRERQKVKKYGPSAAGVKMTGKHGNHARGLRNHRWSGDRRLTDQGYIAVRVPGDHPHAWGSEKLANFKYAYEHHVVVMRVLGRPLLPGEVVHHVNRGCIQTTATGKRLLRSSCGLSVRRPGS